MYSNMASRQWFIGVKSNTDKQKTGSVTPIQTSKAGERSPPLRSVEQILRKLRAADCGIFSLGFVNPAPLQIRLSSI